MLEVHDLRLKFGVHLPIHVPYDYEAFLETSIIADRLGFDYLTVGDHFFLPAELYTKVGGDPNRPDKLDAWTALAAVAARTERIKLGTRVSPIPFYLPSRLAKIVTTVDIISHGRVFLGVGAAWHKEEATSYGVKWGSHAERIERMLEGLRIILSLWSQEKATFEGKYYQVREAPFWPKPVQKPHPPIWFGGSSEAILDAAARYGEGLFPLTDMQPEELVGLHRRLMGLGGRYMRENPPILAPAVSYPGGIGRKKSDWTSKMESQIEMGAGLVLIDFSAGNASVREA
ncbi:MAG: F420-dependent oxidoreductase, partial [Candidatus Bathyarchaeota archaeon B63]